MKKSDLLISGIMGLLVGLIIGFLWIPVMENDRIEKKCMYEHRVEFSGQLYSCQWLEGVTIDNQQYERKPHPLKEILK